MKANKLTRRPFEGCIRHLYGNSIVYHFLAFRFHRTVHPRDDCGVTCASIQNIVSMMFTIERDHLYHIPCINIAEPSDFDSKFISQFNGRNTQLTLAASSVILS